MNRLIVLLFFSSFILSHSAVAQEKSKLPRAIIYIARKNAPMAAATVVVSFSNQKDILLPTNTVLEYELFSTGPVVFTISSPAGSMYNRLSLTVQSNGRYYIVFRGGQFVEGGPQVSAEVFAISNIISHSEDINYPINGESIENIPKKSNAAQCTCMLIAQEGNLITNYHSVENAKELTIKGVYGDFTTSYGVVVVATDPSNDFALLKISNPTVKFTAPPFAIRTTGVNQADRVYALGYPMATSMGSEIKITEGIISAKSGAYGDVSKYQISAAVNPGNSGGPLIDEKGNVIGIVFAKSTVAELSGYAIKAIYLEAFLKSVDGFTSPALVNTIENKTLAEKLIELKKCIFIL